MIGPRFLKLLRPQFRPLTRCHDIAVRITWRRAAGSIPVRIPRTLDIPISYTGKVKSVMGDSLDRHIVATVDMAVFPSEPINAFAGRTAKATVIAGAEVHPVQNPINGRARG